MSAKSFPTTSQSSKKIEIYDEIDNSPVVARERDYSGDYEDESTWDYYTLADGRRCVYRNGFFWEWLDSGPLPESICDDGSIAIYRGDE